MEMQFVATVKRAYDVAECQRGLPNGSPARDTSRLPLRQASRWTDVRLRLAEGFPMC